MPAAQAPCSPCAGGHGADGGHDHGVLPGWPRITAALLLASAAEAAHWLQQGNVGMLLALLAIALSGLGCTAPACRMSAGCAWASTP